MQESETKNLKLQLNQLLETVEKEEAPEQQTDGYCSGEEEEAEDEQDIHNHNMQVNMRAFWTADRSDGCSAYIHIRIYPMSCHIVMLFIYVRDVDFFHTPL